MMTNQPSTVNRLPTKDCRLSTADCRLSTADCRLTRLPSTINPKTEELEEIAPEGGFLLTGAHIITIPPEFLVRMADHKYGRETVRQFITDARKALEMMEKGRSQ